MPATASGWSRRIRLGFVNVESNVAEAWVEVTPSDLTVDDGGFTDFTRAYFVGTDVTLTAEGMCGTKRFKRWLIDGVAQPRGQLTIDITVGDTPHLLHAEYRSAFKPPHDLGHQLNVPEFDLGTRR